MKFMKIGTRPDTFYTEEATRTVVSDVPSDLTIRINNITYLLHKSTLIPKCGLLQRLCSDSEDSSNVIQELGDIPGGEDAFELCAKFCYGITINLSAHNFLHAFCAAKFLRMTEAAEKGNFVMKLEAFFNSCILEGWKDCIVTLQSTGKLPDWSENLGIIRRCLDSIVEKIFTPPVKVTWSYTYTRPGYDKTHHQFVPRDWWTEDISDLDIDLFRCVITILRSTYVLPPQLIGEALHVHACRWLPDTRSSSNAPESSDSQTMSSGQKQKHILETIVSMIPEDQGSVSVRFLLRLLSIAIFLGVSAVTKTELIRKSGQQLEEATLNDLLFPNSHSLEQDHHFYEIDLVTAVLGSFLSQWRRQFPRQQSQSVQSIRKVGKLIDSYFQVVAKDKNMPLQKVISLAETLPEIARPDHDNLYKAINIYLKEHLDLTKDEKKNLCHILDCQKLSADVRAHAVKNERLPLRKVVQLLFFEQERGARSTNHKLQPQYQLSARQETPTTRDDRSKLKFHTDEQSSKVEYKSATTNGILEGSDSRLKLSRGKLQEYKKNVIRKEVSEIEPLKKSEIVEQETSESKLDHHKSTRRTRDYSQNKVRGR